VDNSAGRRTVSRLDEDAEERETAGRESLEGAADDGAYASKWRPVSGGKSTFVHEKGVGSGRLGAGAGVDPVFAVRSLTGGSFRPPSRRASRVDERGAASYRGGQHVLSLAANGGFPYLARVRQRKSSAV